VAHVVNLIANGMTPQVASDLPELDLEASTSNRAPSSSASVMLPAPVVALRR
jgi:hypothetical protein